MNIIGLDIGTTTISAVVIDGFTKKQIDYITVKNESFLPSKNSWERIQDADIIAKTCWEVVTSLSSKHAPIEAIGLTGQMHGILYTDAFGHAVSPLYTWQDGRGNLSVDGNITFAEMLSEKTDYPVFSGYGLVTHAWNLSYGIIPNSANHLTTIGAYVGMKLTGSATPILHVSDAASLGFFSCSINTFDSDALATAGIKPEIFPFVSSDSIIGLFDGHIPVSVSIGDNQASFIGSVSNVKTDALLNLGTGGQISVYSETPILCRDCETRPLGKSGYLIVGASLCGGRAYAILENFFRQCCQFCGKEADSVYEFMNAISHKPLNNAPDFQTLFAGKRFDNSAQASITGLTEENFTPHGLVTSVLHGMANELYGYYCSMLPHLTTKPLQLVCSGNTVQKVPVLRSILSNLFGIPAVVSTNKEEAATGAAFFAYKIISES